MTNDYNKEDVLGFLRTFPVMSMAICAERGPIASVVVFAVDDDFTFYFATHRDSYKAKALLKDKRVGFSVWQLNKMLVQADGQVEEVGGDGAYEVLQKITQSTQQIEDFWPPILRVPGGGYIVFKIKPSWLRAMDLASNTITADTFPFTQII